jgi:hypothetical protein
MAWIKRFTAAALLVACHCPAQTANKEPQATRVLWQPSAIDWPDALPDPTVPREMITTLHVANMPIVLEETNLEEVHKRFGGTVGSHGDASEAEAWLCLHGSDANGPWIFWLQSFEINGPTVGGFQWRRLTRNEIPDRRCKLLHRSEGGIQLPLALHPGMSKLELQKILGQPTFVRGGTFFYCHHHEKFIHDLTYDADNNVAIVLRNGVVWTIEIIKSTVN